MRETIDLGNRRVTLVGTAHVSDQSVTEVENTIDELNPDLVGVELDQDRYQSLRDESGWRNMNVAEAIREGKASLLLFNLMVSVYQRKLGLETGTRPGAEMLRAVEKAEQNGIEFELLDRDINETLSSIRSELSIFEKYMLIVSLIFEGFKAEETDVEQLKQKDIIQSLMDDLEDDYPELKRILLDDRNSFMARRLLEKDFDHAVIVVGAAHVEGIVDELRKDTITGIVESDDSGLPIMKIARYGIPAFIVLGIGYSFYRIGFTTGVRATSFWILSNGILAMLGAILARSHLLTWIVSFIAAPLTSLDPAIGAGMVTSYSEAKFYPPKVGELEDITLIENYRQLWQNQVGRILLTFLFVTIGSASATFISAGYILSLIS